MPGTVTGAINQQPHPLSYSSIQTRLRNQGECRGLENLYGHTMGVFNIRGWDYVPITIETISQTWVVWWAAIVCSQYRSGCNGREGINIVYMLQGLMDAQKMIRAFHPEQTMWQTKHNQTIWVPTQRVDSESLHYLLCFIHTSELLAEYRGFQGLVTSLE